MQTIVYILWTLLPLFFLGHALWVVLEQVGGKALGEKPGDYFRQGLFVTACSVVSYGIDQLILQKYVPIYSPAAIPLWFYQLSLLPIVLVAGAKFLGGSKEIRIEKAPRPSARRKR